MLPVACVCCRWVLACSAGARLAATLAVFEPALLATPAVEVPAKQLPNAARGLHQRGSEDAHQVQCMVEGMSSWHGCISALLRCLQAALLQNYGDSMTVTTALPVPICAAE